ncbi:MAG: hypothetical protein O2900_14725 [Proteobacteria bacterium]|nr:hypothetical protein [Pseudomonadota bacterium]
MTIRHISGRFGAFGRPGACPDHLHLMQVRKKREKRAFLRRTTAAWPLEPS